METGWLFDKRCKNKTFICFLILFFLSTLCSCSGNEKGFNMNENVSTKPVFHKALDGRLAGTSFFINTYNKKKQEWTFSIPYMRYEQSLQGTVVDIDIYDSNFKIIKNGILKDKLEVVSSTYFSSAFDFNSNGEESLVVFELTGMLNYFDARGNFYKENNFSKEINRFHSNQEILVADINNDKKPEIVYTVFDFLAKKPALICTDSENNLLPGFPAHFNFKTWIKTRPVPIDFDNNGLLSLVLIHKTGNISIVRPDGEIVESIYKLSPEKAEKTSIIACDVNNNGQEMLVFASEGDNTIKTIDKHGQVGVFNAPLKEDAAIFGLSVFKDKKDNDIFCTFDKTKSQFVLFDKNGKIVNTIKVAGETGKKPIYLSSIKPGNSSDTFFAAVFYKPQGINNIDEIFESVATDEMKKDVLRAKKKLYELKGDMTSLMEKRLLDDLRSYKMSKLETKFGDKKARELIYSKAETDIYVINQDYKLLKDMPIKFKKLKPFVGTLASEKFIPPKMNYDLEKEKYYLMQSCTEEDYEDNGHVFVFKL